MRVLSVSDGRPRARKSTCLNVWMGEKDVPGRDRYKKGKKRSGGGGVGIHPTSIKWIMYPKVAWSPVPLSPLDDLDLSLLQLL